MQVLEAEEAEHAGIDDGLGALGGHLSLLID
jgi:hypothetical protein